MNADVRSERETSIRRGVETLLSLSSDQAIAEGGLGVTRIAEILGREKSQVSRALSTLAEYGLVDRDPDTLAYRLGWRIFAMANLAGERRLLDYAKPHARPARVPVSGARLPVGAAGVRHDHDPLPPVASRSPGGRLGGSHHSGLLHLGGKGAAVRPQPSGAGARVRRRGVCSACPEHRQGCGRAGSHDRVGRARRLCHSRRGDGAGARSPSQLP